MTPERRKDQINALKGFGILCLATLVLAGYAWLAFHGVSLDPWDYAR